DPKLLGLQVAFLRADDVDRLALPCIVMDFAQIESLPARFGNGLLRVLSVNIETQHEQHVNKRARGGDFAVLEGGEHVVVEEIAAAGVGRADVDAQFTRKGKRFVPNYRFAGAVGIVGGRVLLECDRTIPGFFVARVHGGEQILAALDVLWRSGERRSASAREQKDKCKVSSHNSSSECGRERSSVHQPEMQQVREPDEPDAREECERHQYIVDAVPPPASWDAAHGEKLPERNDDGDDSEPSEDLNETEPRVGARREQVQMRARLSDGNQEAQPAG